MNKLLCFQNGQKVVLDDIVYVDSAYRQAFYGLLSGFGITPQGSYKLSGCDVVKNGNTFTCTEGYIALEGEIFHVPAHTLTISNLMAYTAAFRPVITYDPSPAGNKLFYLDHVTRQCYQIREAKLLATSMQIGIGGVWNYMRYDAPDIIQTIINKENERTGAWQAITVFNTGWTNVGFPNEDCGFRKDAFGNVFLKGQVTSATPVGAMFTLPTGYRPSFDMTFPTYYGSVLTMVMVSSTTGEVFPLGLNTHQNIELQQIWFKI